MKVVMAGLFCGLVFFVWSFISHLALPIGRIGVSSMPADKEEAIIKAMKQGLDKKGFYLFPGIDGSKAPTEQDMNALMEKYKAGPTGVLIYDPAGRDAMSGTTLSNHFIFSLIGGLIIAFILSQMQTSTGMKVLAAGLMGVFAWITMGLSEWNFYNYPTDYILAVGADRLIGWFLGGFFAAWTLRPHEKHGVQETEDSQ